MIGFVLLGRFGIYLSAVFGLVALPAMTACLAVLFRRTGHGFGVVSFLWFLMVLFVFADLVAIISDLQPPTARHGGGFGVLLLLPMLGYLVMPLPMIWLAAKRWPIDRRLAARRYSAGAVLQDGKG